MIILFIFLLFINSLIPIIMLGFGALWKKYPPQTINWAYGYRTKMSMKNEETWKIAHSHHAKVLYRGGIILLIVSLATMILFKDSYEKVIIWLAYSQLAILLVSIIPTEVALRKRFGVKKQ